MSSMTICAVSEHFCPELFLQPRHLPAGGIGRHDEGADPLLAGGGICDREDDRHVGRTARRDELLGAVEDPVVAVAPGARLDGCRIRSGRRLGQRESTQLLAPGERAQEGLFLPVGAEFQDRHAADRIVHAHDRRGRTVAGRDLLDGERVSDVIHARPVEFLGHQHAHEAELAHLANEFARELALLLACGGRRPQALARIGARGIADHLLRFGQFHRLPTREVRSRRS
jgi:hypothetical protein